MVKSERAIDHDGSIAEAARVAEQRLREHYRQSDWLDDEGFTVLYVAGGYWSRTSDIYHADENCHRLDQASAVEARHIDRLPWYKDACPYCTLPRDELMEAVPDASE